MTWFLLVFDALVLQVITNVLEEPVAPIFRIGSKYCVSSVLFVTGKERNI
jgi:hypothetical protein